MTADGTLFTVDLSDNGAATTNIMASQANVTPTPIPAVAWLLGSGLMGLAGIRRRMAA
ncbi:MAG TPA: VPLPA-CTERM sorting domain-containing protein [Nitrospirota bacterium]|nr:VPLPA-CTERM sorting domain-containing protein [Nitrospirota bacterium]